MTKRNTFKYQQKIGNKVVHGGSKSEPTLLYLSALFAHDDHPISR